MSIPPILVAAGTDDYRRRRCVQGIIKKARGDHMDVMNVTGLESAAVESLLGSAGILFDNNTLCVVSGSTEKFSKALLESHSKESDPSVTILMVYETDKVPIADMVPKSSIRVFTLPAFYKMEDYAVEFVRDELRGYAIDPRLILALVRKVGQDLGVLAFEAQKARTLADAKGVKEITSDTLKATMAPLAESDGSGILIPLGAKNKKLLMGELNRYYVSKGTDPTVELCGRTLSPTILKWLQASHLQASGISPSSAAGRVGSNPWYWEHKILPPALNWGVDGCRNLLKIVAASQVLVFSGAVKPWVVLESGLIRACGA